MCPDPFRLSLACYRLLVARAAPLVAIRDEFLHEQSLGPRFTRRGAFTIVRQAALFQQDVAKRPTRQADITRDRRVDGLLAWLELRCAGSAVSALAGEARAHSACRANRLH